MITALDEKKYSETDLIQLKLPLNIPYITNWNDYKRCDGDIVLNGVHYNYVKQKVFNDTMYLYCIPNQQKTELNKTENEFAKQAADNSANKKSEQSSVKRINPVNEYSSALHQYNFSTLLSYTNKFPFFNIGKTAKVFITYPIQPPDTVA